MRAPRPTLPNNTEAARLVRAALVHSFGARDQQLMDKLLSTNAEWTEKGAIAAAERGNFRPLANLLEYRPQDLGPQALALIAAR